MDENVLCLNFKRYGDNIQGFWKNLQSEKYYSDVTLACGNKQIQAHKIILSFFSPILKNILRHISDSNPLIYLTRVKYRELKSLLNYMYNGEVSIGKEDVDSFLDIAQELQLLGLFEKDKSTTKLEILKKEEINDLEGVLMLKEDKKLLNESIENNHQDSREIQDINSKSNSETMIQPKYSEEMFENNQSDKNFQNIGRGKNDQGKNHHLKIKTGKKFPCDICGSTLSGRKPLSRHFLAKHTKERPHKCTECDFETITNTALKNHIESKHRDNTYTCFTCGEKFRTKLSIFKHERYVHREKSFICNHCGKIFKIESKLENHIGNLHSTVKIKCSDCSKTFPSEQYLKEHARQHDIKNLLPCTFCIKTFARKQKIEEHINIHTGNSPFICPQTKCKKMFKSSSSLAHHKKSCNEF